MVHDEHIRERAADIRDVGQRLLLSIRDLKNAASGEHRPKTDKIADRRGQNRATLFLLVNYCRQIFQALSAPALAVLFRNGQCAQSQRCFIMMPNGIPTVMGVEGLAGVLRDGDFVIVDSSKWPCSCQSKRIGSF